MNIFNLPFLQLASFLLHETFPDSLKQKLIMDFLKIGRGKLTYGKPSSIEVKPYRSNAASVPEPMSAQDASDTPRKRVSGPTLTERVRELATGRRSFASLRGTQTAENVIEETPVTAPITPQRRSHDGYVDPEISFKEKYIPALNINRPINERIVSVKEACREIEGYSVETLMAIWEVAADLTDASTSLEARRAGYELIMASVAHPGLSPDERENFFNMIIIPLPPAYSDLQAAALHKLTRKGGSLSPFDSRLMAFLNCRLEEVFEATLKARKIQRRQRSLDSNDPIGEEAALLGFLGLTEDILNRSPEAFVGPDLALLIDGMIGIANRTTASDDINRAVAIFELLTISGRMPGSKLEPCVEVLCAMAGMSTTPFGDVPSNCLDQMLSSNYRSDTLNLILNIISIEPRERKPNVLRGAFLTLDSLLLNNAASDLPIISVPSLITAFNAIWRVSSIYTLECLRVVGRLLHEEQVVAYLVREGWRYLEETLDEFAKLTMESSVGNDEWRDNQGSTSQPSPFRRYYSGQWSNLHSYDVDLKKSWRRIASAFSCMWDDLNKEQRLFVVNVFLILAPYVDDDLLDLVINYMIDEELISPLNDEWIRHVELLLDLVLFDSTKAYSTRCLVLETVKKLYMNIEQLGVDASSFDQIGLKIFRKMVNEDQMLVVNELAEFAVFYARDASSEVFDRVIETLAYLVGVQHIIGPLPQSSTISDLSPNLIITCLVRLFLQCLPSSADKTCKIYQTLVSTASNQQIPPNTRLTAMKLLTRIRCESNYAIKVIPDPDSQGLAAAIYRTEASAHRQSTYQASTNRVSFNDESQVVRTGRSGAIGSSRTGRSRSTTRSASAKARAARAVPPLWLYGVSKGLPEDPPSKASEVVFASTKHSGTGPTLNISLWMDLMHMILRYNDDWEILSYILVHLPSQLGNLALFEGDAEHVQTMHTTVLHQLQSANFHTPPASTGVKKGDIALCLFHTLTVLIGYHGRFTRQQLHDTVKVFLAGISMWDRAAKCCIHALALCCHEIPVHVDRSLNNIVQKLSQIVTQTHLAMDVLEFLGGLSRLPDAYRSNGQDLFRIIFGICIRYLHHSWEQRQKLTSEPSPRASFPSARYSGTSSDSPASPEFNNSEDSKKELPEYVFALAYHVITYWFLTISIPERSTHVGWIAKSLAWKNNMGLEIMEEQSQVTLDMMHRTAYLDLGESMPDPDFNREDGTTTKKTWLVGLSIVTIETFKDSGASQITKRQASGTTHASYKQQTAPLPPHHIQARSSSNSTGPLDGLNILPNHILLQQTSTITPMPIPLQPIILPDDEITRRAISTFDRNDTVDGHKAGVIYVGNGQSSETEILANTAGSSLYDTFLSGLGTKVELQGAKFNTQGLDRESNMDGAHTYAWRDRVTEIVFHVITMMPTDIEHDPQCVNKKRHIGNDFVNIIFNESGLPFNFNTFKSQFNYVNIVITPELMAFPHRLYSIRDDVLGKSSAHQGMDEEGRSDPRHCFKVQTICFPSFPEISPAATPKIVSASALPGFVRQLALNASVFSLVWSNREGGEHISSWRNRLKQIIKLRERYANTSVSANVAYPEMGTAEDRGGARSYLEGDEWRGTFAMGGLAEENRMLLSLDFTRWA